MADKKTTSRRTERSQAHIPSNSVFYEKIVPILLVGLGLIMLALIVVAAGILLGFISYR